MMNSNNISKEQIFLSGKSRNELLYRNSWELDLIKKFDQDSTVSKIEQFLLPIVDNKTFLVKAECVGFFLHKTGHKSVCLVVSDYLAANPHLANQLKTNLAAGKKYKFKFIFEFSTLAGLRY